MELVDTFAVRLQKAMKYSNMRQVDLVEKTNLDKTLINKYLSGKMKAKQSNLTILADALNVNEVWLMGYDVSMDRNLSDSNSNNTVFKYKITDNSMANVLDIGDIAIIKEQSKFKTGDTILFKLNDKDYIRKVIAHENYIELRPMNTQYEIMIYTKSELEEKKFIVIGKVIKAENTSAFK